MNKEVQRLFSELTCSVPDAGRICFGLSRNASYDAAKRGEIPTIKMGNLLRVPTYQLRKMLGMEEEQ